MLARAGLILRRWRATNISNHSIMATITRISDLESYGKLKLL